MLVDVWWLMAEFVGGWSPQPFMSLDDCETTMKLLHPQFIVSSDCEFGQYLPSIGLSKEAPELAPLPIPRNPQTLLAG